MIAFVNQLWISLLVLMSPATAQTDGSGAKTKATLLYCSDGDTCRIKVADGSMWMNVRLFGIDAPETAKARGKKSGQAMGEEAKNFLNGLVQGKEVNVTQADLDHYNRPVVELFLGDQSVNVQLVEQGLAEVYRGKTKRIDKNRFEEAEAKAKGQAVGIWSQKDYQSPATFRKSQR